MGIQDTRERETNCLQIKMKGNPWWTSDGLQINHARMLICSVLSAMDENGFELVASVDMSTGSKDVGECESD